MAIFLVGGAINPLNIKEFTLGVNKNNAQKDFTDANDNDYYWHAFSGVSDTLESTTLLTLLPVLFSQPRAGFFFARSSATPSSAPFNNPSFNVHNF
ncbi:hypothetical protein [Pantoea allii]|uniref:hypothetical protein n=1 Tax=Pantoea allii TaxID=574096 RepID=UPI0024B73F4A|nr:hypothetical protein [Pantoea allii]MDJ0089083.1 hypothetical protein [Pantoea allii]